MPYILIILGAFLVGVGARKQFFSGRRPADRKKQGYSTAVQADLIMLTGGIGLMITGIIWILLWPG